MSATILLAGCIVRLGSRSRYPALENYLALDNTIVKSLIGALHSMPKEWQPLIDVQAGIETELRIFARNSPADSCDFLVFLLRNRQRFREAVVLSATPRPMRDEIGELMNRRFATRASKEKAVSKGRYERASRYLKNQNELTNELNEKLMGQTLFVTIKNVKEAIAQMGWPEGSK